MEVISILTDNRINAINVLVEFSIGEYLDIAQKIIVNNPLQRKRVKSSSTVYSLLREDLKQGCIIPPIVMALSKTVPSKEKPELEKFILENITNSLILDGLQRTYNIIDANDELLKVGDSVLVTSYHKNKLRCEFYLGIDKIGILYRMLTLNTGQTPMSLRHQIEILYSDYLRQSYDGVRLLREIDDKPARNIGEYSFKDIIEGFTSYLLRDYLTFDRSDILENIKSLEKLSKENAGADIFKSFLRTFHSFVLKGKELIGNWSFQEDAIDSSLTAAPFGKDAQTIFNKSQVMTGFGAAIGFLRDRELSNFEKIYSDINSIRSEKDGDDWITNLLVKLDDIRRNASKIGNAQREYFFYFFRELFNPEGDSYLNIDAAIENAFKRYRQNA